MKANKLLKTAALAVAFGFTATALAELADADARYGAYPDTTLGDELIDTFDCVIMPHAVVDVSSGVSGRIESLNVERGDTVTKGQLVAKLESGVEQANRALARARADIDTEILLRAVGLKYDKVMRERVGTLYARAALATVDKDQADRDAELSVLRVREARERKLLAQLELRRAEEILKLRSVLSPIDGVVVERFRWAGEYVEEDPIVRVAQLDPLRVEVIVPVQLHGAIQRSLPAEVYAETEPDNGRHATVRVVDPTGDPASGTFRVQLELPNPDNRLIGGIKCKARFTLLSADATEADTASGLAASETGPTPGLNVAAERFDADPVQPDSAATLAAMRGPDVGGLWESAAVFERPGEPRLISVGLEPLQGRALPEDDGRELSQTDGAQLPQVDTRELPEDEDREVPEDANPEPPQKNMRSCRLYGPLDNAETAERIVHTVASRSDASATLREGEQAVPIGFLVLAAPPAGEKLSSFERRLRKAGVSDTLIMASGAYGGHVSLGAYNGPAMAERRVAAIATLGFEAYVAARTRSRPAWWVELSVDDKQTDLAAITDLVSAIEPALAKGPSSCDTGTDLMADATTW